MARCSKTGPKNWRCKNTAVAGCRLCAHHQQKSNERNKRAYASDPERARAFSRKYRAKPEARETQKRYWNKRTWIINRLLKIAREDGTYQQLEALYGKRSL